MGDNAGVQNSNPDDGLKINCNDFTNSNSNLKNKWDVAMVNANLNVISQSGNYNVAIAPTVRLNQGVVVITQNGVDPKKLVRNMYGANSLGTATENKWYIVGTSVKQQYNHASNSQAYTKPIPKPQYSDVAVNTITTTIPLDYTAHCKSNSNSSGGDGGNPQQRLTNMNTYLAELKSENTGEQDYSEIQATNIAKLNLFLTDSVDNYNDSVVRILTNNEGNMLDADLLSVFANVNKGDYTQASSQISNLSINRSNWTNLLNKYVNVEQQEGKFYSWIDNDTDLDYLNHLADNDTLNGNNGSKSILNLISNRAIFIEPFLIDEQGGGERMTETSVKNFTLLDLANNIKVFPNPANDNIQVQYSLENGKELTIELRDAIGKLVYKNKIKPYSTLPISLSSFENGVYVLSAYEGKSMIYRTKVVCIK
ncbi:MAG: T9SS type A sorting domain-containing protein [Bacteroidota bacterium]